MEAQAHPPVVYREHNIVFNPSGRADDALADAFIVLAPTVNPMFSPILFKNPNDKVRRYGTEDDAYGAAIAQARKWIDAHLDGTEKLAVQS